MWALSYGANNFNTGYWVRCSERKGFCILPPMQKVFQSHMCVLPLILLTFIVGVYFILPENNVFPLFLLYFCPPFIFSWRCCWFWHDAVIGRRLVLGKSLFLSGEKSTYDWTILILNNSGAPYRVGVFSLDFLISCIKSKDLQLCTSKGCFVRQVPIPCVKKTKKSKTRLKSGTLIVSLQTFHSSFKCDKNNFEVHAGSAFPA